MEQLELNVIESFRRAKTDIIQLQNQLIDLSKKQEDLIQILLDTRNKESQLYQRVKELSVPKPDAKVYCKPIKKEYVASKAGKNFHIPQCPFAKNIKPKSKVNFKSKSRAMNSGYKACDCVKRI
jgi:hypothetical protein